jgi:hypothetical protein
MMAQLQDLILMAYEGNAGRSLPDLLKSARAASQPQTQAQPARPTLQPTIQPAGVTVVGQQDLATPEGRKAIIDSGRQKKLFDQLFAS